MPCGMSNTASWGKPAAEHFFVVTAIDAPTGALVCTEGGQGARGAAIAEGRRLLVWRGNELWAVKADAQASASGLPAGRRVVGWCSALVVLSPASEP